MSDTFDRTLDLVGTCGEDLLARSLSYGGILADIFAEERVTAFMSLRTGRGRPVEQDRVRMDSGAGIHVFDGIASGYAYTDDASLDALRNAADNAATSFRRSASGKVGASDPANSSHPVLQGELRTCGDLPADGIHSITAAEGQAIMHRAAESAWSLMPALERVSVELQGQAGRFVVASSDGRFARSARSAIGLRVTLLGRDGRESDAIGGGGGGSGGGLGIFLAQRPEDIAREAAERMRAAHVDGGESLQGEHAVVIGGGWGGVWLHEVIGHALECDVGVYGPGDLGEQVARTGIHVMDDPTLEEGRGHVPVDDEGTIGKESVLIDNGVLRGLLTDRTTALKSGLPESGNGRRQDYRHAPMPRMTNLLLSPGTASPDDLIREAGTGLYVRMIGSGSVVPADDTFSFEVAEGYLIESGRIGRAVRRLRLQGRASDMLRRIAGVADDFSLDPGRGTCEKLGQVVPVSVGMPTILLDRITVNPLA